MTLALYRRYRSETFSALVGQDVIARTLRNEVRTGALVHAYLFTGVRGTGKTSTARILARAVNCLQPRDGEPCNECVACIEILSGAAVDVLEIDAASNRGIDEMRDLRDKVKYLPASLRRKVYIIDEAHMLTTEAWNAFLKTLEEPPDHVLFVLATTEPHKVPDTVRSRVQRFDFRRIGGDAILGHLQRIGKEEGLDVEPAAFSLIARAAQGSMRDALSLLDQCTSTGESPLTLAGARRALGLTDPSTLHDLVRSLAGADAAEVLRAASRAFDAGADPRQLLREIGRLARAAELTLLGFPEGADVSPDEAELCADVAAVAPPGFWLTALDLFAASEMNLRQPIDARLQVELCLLRLVRPPHGVIDEAALTALEARLTALERAAAEPGGAMTPQRAAPAPAAQDAVGKPEPDASPAPVRATETDAVLAPAAPVTGAARDPGSVEGWRDEWQMLIEAVTRADQMLAGVLRDCRPVEAEPGRLVIGARGQFHYDRIRDPAKRETLAAAVANVAGHPVTVETRFVGEEKASQQGAGVMSDVTRTVLETFAGSRVTATRLVDHADAEGPATPRAG